MGRVAQSIQEMFAMRHMMRRQMEEDLVRLAIVVARRILHRELTVDPEALLGVVKAAVEKIESRELNRIRMSAADAPVLQQILSRASLPERVQLVPDSGLERGSVILETTRGILDSSITTQLEEIERGFVDLVKRPS
jgi:flagellar assembly protein FliH